MSTPVTKQQLVDAGTDAQTLADVMNSTADSVTTRTGATLPTMKKALQLSTGPQGAQGPQGIPGQGTGVATPINIFDATLIASGAINSSTGADDTTQNWLVTSGFMNLRGAAQWCSNAPLHTYSPSNLGIAYYDTNHVFISGETLSTPDASFPIGHVFTVPAGAVYVRCSISGPEIESFGIVYETMMCLAGPTVPSVYQPFDADSVYGVSGVQPAVQLSLAFYKHAGASLIGASISTDPTGVHLNVPGNAGCATETLDFTHVQPTGIVTSDFAQRRMTGRIQGPGRSFGNDGGWTVGFSDSTTFDVAQRGIHQMRSGTIQKHAVGDTAGIYQYVKSDGGIQAASDEGVTGATIEVSENPGYFHGHVATTIGHGDIQPVFAFDSGNNWTTDGAFMLNITKGVYHGNMLSASQGVSLTTASGGAQAMAYLHFLPVTAASVPVSTAIGIVLDSPAGAVNSHTVDDPQQVDKVVRLAQIGGVYPVFTVGSYVIFAGTNYPEQAKLLAVVDHGDGTMTLTMKLRNPNGQATIFQGGIAGQFISFDANIAFSGMRSSYFAFGSLTGNDLIYGVQMGGGMGGVTLPQGGCEAALADGGASSGFHLYPGAEIVANHDQNFNCTLEQNNVTWAVNDVVENPHFPVFGGTGLWVTRFQNTPSNSAFGQTGFALDVGGTGFGGGNVAMIRANNNNPPSYYDSNGGPLSPPVGLMLTGTYSNTIYAQRAPSGNNALLVCDTPANTSAPDVPVKVLSVINGTLTFNPATQTWITDNLTTANLAVNNSLSVAAGANFLSALQGTGVQITGQNEYKQIIFNTSLGSQGITAYSGDYPLNTNMYYDTFNNFMGPASHQFRIDGRTSVSIDGTGLHIGPTSGTVNGTLNFGANYSAPAITLYDGGAGNRYGWGLNSGEMQFFVGATAHFSWNKGGDLQATGTNEIMHLDGDTGKLSLPGKVDAGSFAVGGVAGATGTFTSADGKTITVTNGLITGIV